MSSCTNCHGSNVRHTSSKCPKFYYEIRCPEKNCGYIASDRFELKKHYAKSHVNYLITVDSKEESVGREI